MSPNAVHAAHLVAEEPHVGRHAHDPFLFGRIAGQVVHRGCDGAGDVGAVTMIVHRIAVAGVEVEAPDVVAGEIGVSVVDAGIDDGDLHR